MTRRLRLAGAGLCAFLLPACMGTTRPDPYYTGNQGFVLMNRPGANPNARKQVLDSQARRAEPTYPPVVVVEPDKKPAEVASGVQVPDDPTPPAQPVKHEQAGAVVTPPDPVLTAPEGPKVADASRGAGVLNDPVRFPDFPKIGGMDVGAPTPAKPPEALPKLDPPVAPGAPTSSEPMAGLVPPPAPEVKPAEVGVSLKVPEPVAPTVVPAAPPPAALSSADETVIVRAIKAFQENRPQEAAAALKQLDPANQDVLMYLMPLIVRLGDGSVNAMPPEELAIQIDRLQNAAGMLKSKAALRADRVCFCRGVRKFADIDPFDARHEFRPGDMVFLYAELKNFTCEPIIAQPRQPLQRGFSIRLATTLELRDARNNLVWRTDLTKTDFAQSPPQDYYHTYRFCVPERLPPGAYTLYLNITDKPTGRTVRKPVEMRVGQQ